MFRGAGSKYADMESMQNKSYEEILEEYEKFFSLDEELN